MSQGEDVFHSSNELPLLYSSEHGIYEVFQYQNT